MQQIICKRLDNSNILIDQLIELSKKFKLFSLLNSNDWQFDRHKKYDILAAFGATKETSVVKINSFDLLEKEHSINKEWLFTYLSYDLKNELEDLQSNNLDFIEAPNMQFFSPQLLVLLQDRQLKILVHQDYLQDQRIKDSIDFILSPYKATPIVRHKKIDIKHRINKEQYLESIANIQKHIKHGDIYELNFCQEFYAEHTDIIPSDIYRKLIKKSPTPFSAFMRFNHHYLMSASPERYIQKTGNTMISQPIKGTARRHKNAHQDHEVVTKLQNDKKERAENIMIVDLVRNDLARTAKKGSVKVDELCKIYSFEQVHQMISSIRSQIDSKYSFADVLKTTFPMGSMTGAPKIKAMQLIEQYEHSKRGIYSGAVGYISPEGDFDFNVVIRSLVYNQAKKALSFIAGGAITFQSDAEQEYAESMLKAEAIREILS